MENSRPLVPNFLKKIDRSLLLNSPSVWSTRTHLVLFFGVSFAILLALFSMLIFRDARQENGVEILTGFVCLICGIGFIFWLIYLLRFNVFKRYGNWVTGDGIRTLGLFFINILLLVAIPFIPLSIESYMANRQYSKSELIKDINELNTTANKLEYDKLPDEWEKSTLKIVDIDYYVERSRRDTIWGRNDDDRDYYLNQKLTTYKKIAFELSLVDSVRKINDSLYYTYKCPVFKYVKPYNLSITKTDTILSDLGIYKTALQHYIKPDKAVLLKRIAFLKSKYFAKEDYTDEGNSYQYDYEKDRIGYVESKYSLNTMENSINRIERKQDQFFNLEGFALHFIIWFTLSISLLLFVFRHTTVKTFFLTALATVILAILSGLFIGLTDGRETSVYTLMILYYAFFGVVAFSIFSSKTKTVFKGIALNIFLLGLPIMPIIITALYFSIKEAQYNYYRYDYIDTTLYFIGAQIIGVILLIILIEPLFKKLYRAWYAAAEE